MSVDGWVIHNEKERECVDELRKRLQDLKGEEDATHNLGDVSLVRYARARRCKVGAAEKLYRATAAWRKEIDPQNIAETFEPGNLISTFRPGGFLGCDKLGCPVFYDRIGQADPKVLAHLRRCPAEGKDASATDQLRDFEILKQEVLTEVFKRCSEKEGREIYQTFVVQDLRGLGMHHLTKATIDVVQAVLGTLDEHYPLRFRKLIIIHPPMVFSAAWNIVKHFVHETTREQVEVVSGNPAKTLLKHIDADQLPKALGGNLVINGDEYCNPPIVAGGRIPKDFDATPSKYAAKKQGLPLHIYVPARRSVKVGPNSGLAMAVEAAEPEQPEGILDMFQKTIDAVTEWVRNLRPDESLVEDSLDGDSVADEPDIKPAIEDDGPQARLPDAPKPACACCVIS